MVHTVGSSGSAGLVAGYSGWMHESWNRMLIPLTHLYSSSRDSLRSMFLSAEGCGCLAEGRGSFRLRFDCSQYGSFAVVAVYLLFPAVLCGCEPQRTMD